MNKHTEGPTFEDDAQEGPMTIAGNERAHRNIFQPAGEASVFAGYEHLGFVKDIDLLERLIKRMEVCYSRNDRPRRDCVINNNTKITAGYTYLAQLVAHDLLQNLAPLPRIGDKAERLARDFRSGRLLLDTLYGGGPINNPTLYAISENVRGLRGRFRLGRVRPKDELGRSPAPPREHAPALDIPRASCPFLNDMPGPGAPEVLIADARNDDHVIISQMTALFQMLHNAVFDRLEKASGSKDTYRTFLAAQRVVTFIYRKIIREDLLRLLLDPAVYNFYNEAEGRAHFLDRGPRSTVPLEFSHAAFRLGHVMVQFGYKLNETLGFTPSIKQILDQSSARRPDKMPLAANWVIEWAQFFDVDPATEPNPSRRIEPYIRGDLTTSSHFAVPEKPDQGLFLRDLIRGTRAGLLTVATLTETIQESHLKDLHSSKITRDPKARKAALGAWLTDPKAAVFSKDTDEEAAIVEAIATDPPLFLYLLFEAAHDAKGEHLGVLGSTIVAEVFFSALARTEHRIERDPELSADLGTAFAGETAPATMPDLIKVMRNMLKRPL